MKAGPLMERSFELSLEYMSIARSLVKREAIPWGSESPGKRKFLLQRVAPTPAQPVLTSVTAEGQIPDWTDDGYGNRQGKKELVTAMPLPDALAVARREPSGCVHVIMTNKIGQGGFGDVWKGLLDESTEGGPPEYLVAVKTVKVPGIGGDASGSASTKLSDALG